MKVAILGAGLSGLACAKYLESQGINPEIYERRHRVGERFPNMEAIMQLMYRPIEDPLVDLSKKYDISLVPAGLVHTLEIFSPNQKAVLTGYNLGYTSIRGNDERSLERQLARQVKSKIHFKSTVTWQELEKDYDFIVVATGDSTISRELGVWKTDTEAFLKGCIVKGSFNLGVSKIWLNQKLSKQCMVYCSPFDTNEASFCVVAIPSSPEEIDDLWSRTVKELNLTPVPGTEFKFEEYKLGQTSTLKIGKILLTGAAGGFVEPFMGFGQIPSMLSGIHAATSIITGKSYDELAKPHKKHYLDCLAIRNYVNSMDNEGFDKLVSFLNTPMVSKIIAHHKIPIISLVANIVRSRNFLRNP